MKAIWTASEIWTAESAKDQEIAQTVPEPILHERVGSGTETTLEVLGGGDKHMYSTLEVLGEETNTHTAH